MKRLVECLSNPYIVSTVQNIFGLHLNCIEAEEVEETIINKNIKSDQEQSVQRKDQYCVKLLDNKKCIYTVKYPVFYYFFNFITQFGNEAFYISFLPIMCWNYDDKLIFFTGVAWALTMYIGQATKEIVKIPRPMTPPVVKVEEKYLLEYGINLTLFKS
jgi:hypothetical protein